MVVLQSKDGNYNKHSLLKLIIENNMAILLRIHILLLILQLIPIIAYGEGGLSEITDYGSAYRRLVSSAYQPTTVLGSVHGNLLPSNTLLPVIANLLSQHYSPPQPKIRRQTGQENYERNNDKEDDDFAAPDNRISMALSRKTFSLITSSRGQLSWNGDCTLGDSGETLLVLHCDTGVPNIFTDIHLRFESSGDDLRLTRYVDGHFELLTTSGLSLGLYAMPERSGGAAQYSWD